MISEDEKTNKKFFGEFLSILTLPIRGMERRLTNASISHSLHSDTKINNKHFLPSHKNQNGKKFRDEKMSKQVVDERKEIVEIL